MKKLVLVALILVLITGVAQAGYVMIQLRGKVFNTFPYYEFNGTYLVQSGCFIDVDYDYTSSLFTVLVRGADQLSCSSMYRIGRKFRAEGQIISPTGFVEISYLTWEGN